MGIKTSKPYRIERRTKHLQSGKKLNGIAIDLILRFNKDGHPFLQDKNATPGRNVMPFNDVEEVMEFITAEISRNYNEHFLP
jgi:hypothetical protein